MKTKNTWKMRKDEEGVSPVIATILMVAITVVLAAVLYTMVMIDPVEFKLSTGSWNDVSATSRDTAKAEFGQFGGVAKPTKIKVYISVNESEAGYISWGSDTDPDAVTWVNAPPGAAVTYHDYEPELGQVNSGDYLKMTGLAPGSVYELEVFNTDDGSKVQMSGSGRFITPS